MRGWTHGVAQPLHADVSLVQCQASLGLGDDLCGMGTQARLGTGGVVGQGLGLCAH